MPPLKEYMTPIFIGGNSGAGAGDGAGVGAGAGDGAGVSRGLIQSSASGVVAAREILRRSGH